MYQTGTIIASETRKKGEWCILNLAAEMVAEGSGLVKTAQPSEPRA
jgi:hypothetical protein